MKRISFVVVGVLLLGVWSGPISQADYIQTGVPTWPAIWLADSVFFDVWARSDGPVAMQAVGRSWSWGPVPFAVANEAYAESPTGKRLVEYFDKGRMEANDPGADRASGWFVTSGLLVSELVSGRMQVGNSSFEARPPSSAPVAGDMSGPNAPSYAAFSALTAPVARSTGSLAQQLISEDGSVRPLEGGVLGASQSASMPGSYDEVSGHNVPAVFAEWMGQTGAVLQGGRLSQGRIMDPLFVLGRPITEPYWADVLVGGARARVMLQLFERRSLTYSPANPPQWQVEMANVGRAYYDWRYGGATPEPAISAELAADGVQIRGWNWPADVQVSAHIDLAGASAPVAGPLTAQSDSSGRFGLFIQLNPQLEGALVSGANLRGVASAGDRQTALPLAAQHSSGGTTLEGMLTGVVPRSGGYVLLMKDYTGREWKVSLAGGAVVSYSEGDETQQEHLVSGDSARVEGTVLSGRINARSLRLMSVSRTGARLGYEFLPGENGIRVSGVNWPPSRNVAFSLRTFAGESGVRLGTARADSRGNVTAPFVLPSADATRQPLWLFAQVVEQNSLVAQVAVLYRPAEAANAPPTLSLLANGGEQMGGLGEYCQRGQCVDAVGVPIPGEAVPVVAGEVLGLRSQLGPGPELGVLPQRFTAQLYAYPTEPASEGAVMGGTFYYSPKSLPVFSTGEVPGRPFSVSLPSTLPGGKYLLVASVVWSGGPGPSDEAIYGFALEVQAGPAKPIVK